MRFCFFLCSLFCIRCLSNTFHIAAPVHTLCIHLGLRRSFASLVDNKVHNITSVATRRRSYHRRAEKTQEDFITLEDFITIWILLLLRILLPYGILLLLRILLPKRILLLLGYYYPIGFYYSRGFYYHMGFYYLLLFSGCLSMRCGVARPLVPPETCLTSRLKC